MDLAGPPFYIQPAEALREWTLPQVLFAYVKQQELQAADARQTFQLTMAAIGAVFAKNGGKIAKSVLDALAGPATTVEEMAEQMTEAQRKVLFGSKRRGRKTSSDM